MVQIVCGILVILCGLLLADAGSIVLWIFLALGIGLIFTSTVTAKTSDFKRPDVRPRRRRQPRQPHVVSVVPQTPKAARQPSTPVKSGADKEAKPKSETEPVDPWIEYESMRTQLKKMSKELEGLARHDLKERQYDFLKRLDAIVSCEEKTAKLYKQIMNDYAVDYCPPNNRWFEPVLPYLALEEDLDAVDGVINRMVLLGYWQAREKWERAVSSVKKEESKQPSGQSIKARDSKPSRRVSAKGRRPKQSA